jgi:hypothetical protein
MLQSHIYGQEQWTTANRLYSVTSLYTKAVPKWMKPMFYIQTRLFFELSYIVDRVSVRWIWLHSRNIHLACRWIGYWSVTACSLDTNQVISLTHTVSFWYWMLHVVPHVLWDCCRAHTVVDRWFSAWLWSFAHNIGLGRQPPSKRRRVFWYALLKRCISVGMLHNAHPVCLTWSLELSRRQCRSNKSFRWAQFSWVQHSEGRSLTEYAKVRLEFIAFWWLVFVITFAFVTMLLFKDSIHKFRKRAVRYSLFVHVNGYWGFNWMRMHQCDRYLHHRLHTDWKRACINE